ncbi:aminopeptidase-like protein Y [Lasiosphaeris hirsuta]|uniref:Peptide hydrolase n=1 Tax=Lasiosphaeris hirsuta TaxID=260670 RepID=A0AA40A9J6_9PEZI|nr:aminopeptidase-like protein Y [Lasiosphaeris hirsuta]
MGLKGLALSGLVALASASALQQKPILNDATAEQAPIGIGASKKPLIDSEALQSTISTAALLARAKHLYKIAKLGEDEYNHPTRVIGSKGHRGTLKYIYKSLQELGGYYTLSRQPFPAVSGNVFESRLIIDRDVPRSASPMALTPPTKHKEPVDGDLVLVANDGCEAADYPKAVAGNIAFIKRGVCPFGTKSALAGKAGAVAAVVYNYEHGPVAGTLGTPSKHHVATFGLSGTEAAKYIAELKAGDRVPATAYIDAEVETVITHNIIAQTTQGDPENCVMLGGHSDSVPEGPGINDDGSGSLTLLEVASQLTNFTVNNCVRFAWWAGEEEGLLGSDYYVDVLPAEENKKIRLFMDYDMLASPNFAYQVYDARNNVNPVGSEQLRDLYVDWYKKQGVNYTFIPFDGRSDYDGFIRSGIPGGGIATGAEGIKTEREVAMFGGEDGVPYDVCYHALCDNVHNLNLTAWELNTKLVAHSVATFAKSFEGFPERTDGDYGVVRTAEEIKSLSMDPKRADYWRFNPQRIYHGSKLTV